MPKKLHFPKSVPYKGTIHGPGEMTVADADAPALMELGGLPVEEPQAQDPVSKAKGEAQKPAEPDTAAVNDAVAYLRDTAGMEVEVYEGERRIGLPLPGLRVFASFAAFVAMVAEFKANAPKGEAKPPADPVKPAAPAPSATAAATPEGQQTQDPHTRPVSADEPEKHTPAVPTTPTDPETPAGGQPSTPSTSTASDLPADFPQRDVLIAAGIDTLEKVNGHDFDASRVPGIGPANAARIAEALNPAA